MSMSPESAETALALECLESDLGRLVAFSESMDSAFEEREYGLSVACDDLARIEEGADSQLEATRQEWVQFHWQILRRGLLTTFFAVFEEWHESLLSDAKASQPKIFEHLAERGDSEFKKRNNGLRALGWPTANAGHPAFGEYRQARMIRNMVGHTMRRPPRQDEKKAIEQLRWARVLGHLPEVPYWGEGHPDGQIELTGALAPEMQSLLHQVARLIVCGHAGQ